MTTAATTPATLSACCAAGTTTRPACPGSLVASSVTHCTSCGVAVSMEALPSRTRGNVETAGANAHRAVCPVDGCGFLGYWEIERRVAELDAEGHALVEHATPLPTPAPAVVRCDSCQKPVSARQADKYADLQLDWALCTPCERNT